MIMITLVKITNFMEKQTFEYRRAMSSSDLIFLHLVTPKSKEISVITPVNMSFLRSINEKLNIMFKKTNMDMNFVYKIDYFKITL